MPSRLTRNSSLRIAVIFMAVGLLWIFLSDRLVGLLLIEVDEIIYFQHIKGAFFVTATAVLIYFLVNRELKQKNRLIEFLNKSEHWYNVMVSNIPNVDVYLFDPDEKLILSQGSVLLSLGIDMSTDRGNFLFDCGISDEAKAYLIPKMKEVLKGGAFEDVYEVKDKHLQFHAVGLLNSEAEVFAGLLVITDVTKQFHLIKKLKSGNQKFEKLYKEYYLQNAKLTEQNISLHELNNDLLIAQKKAEESDRLKTSFLTNMSHEIRTPLNAIIGFSQIMYSDALGKDEIAEYSKIIAHSGEDLLIIIDDILLMSQLEAEQYDLKIRTLKLKSLWEELTFFSTEFLARTQSGRKLILNFDEKLGDIDFDCDLDSVLVVLKRLLDNAIKFSEESTPIRLELFIKDKGLSISVEDKGIGIPEDKFDEVFVRFSQIKTNSMQPIAGNGLGLSIVKNIVTYMGATVTVDSKLGKGSVFTVHFPGERISNRVNYRIMKERKTMPTARKILIVEDVMDNFILLKAYLKNYKVSLHHVASASMAKQFIHENEDVDLIMMDIRLPDDNGIALTKYMRENRVTCPIIAQTAYADSQDKFQCIEAGCSDYLSKPIHKAIFLETVGKFVVLEKKKRQV